MPKKRTVIILFIVSIVALMTACSGKDLKPEQKAYIAWSNNQESYSFISTLRTVEAAGAKPVVLKQALSYDLHYDSKGELAEADEDEHGILTSQAAKMVKANTWQNSNVEEIMKDVDCVIFTGGSFSFRNIQRLTSLQNHRKGNHRQGSFVASSGCGEHRQHQAGNDSADRD